MQWQQTKSRTGIPVSDPDSPLFACGLLQVTTEAIFIFLVGILGGDLNKEYT